MAVKKTAVKKVAAKKAAAKKATAKKPATKKGGHGPTTLSVSGRHRPPARLAVFGGHGPTTLSVPGGHGPTTLAVLDDGGHGPTTVNVSRAAFAAGAPGGPVKPKPSRRRIKLDDDGSGDGKLTIS